MSHPKFQIICQDALKWLQNQSDRSIPNIVTGIPDMSEVNMTPQKYLLFVRKTIDLFFRKIDPKGYVLLQMTDRKYQKTWIDKSYLAQKIAEEHQISLRWHKLILLRPVGSTHIQRPTYQHYLCFSYQSGPGEATPDVTMCGKKSYKNASCPNGTKHAIQFIKRYSPFNMIVDPFVGRGTTLIEAQKQRGLEGLGIDLDRKQCVIAKASLGLTQSRKKSKSKKRSKRRSRKRSKKRR